MEIKIYFELVEQIRAQDEIIKIKDEIIIKLINENAEQENMIDVLMKSMVGDDEYVG